MKKPVAIFCIYALMTLGVGCAGMPLPGVSLSPTTSSSEEHHDPTPPTQGGESFVQVPSPAEGTQQTPTATSEEPGVDTVPTLMSPPSGTEQIQGIAAGQPSPFEGVVLNADAAAWLMTEPDAVQQRCQAFVDRRTGELRARLLAETDQLQLRLRTTVQIDQIELRARDQQILTLQQMNEHLRNSSGQWWEQALFVGGGVVVGLLAGLLIAIFAR